MQRNIILPTVDAGKKLADAPLFFLAGPVRGGGDWQARMYRLLTKKLQDYAFFVAVPCRWTGDHELAEHFMSDEGEGRFARQLDWERHYLYYAAQNHPNQNGCVIFWLGCESSTNPHPGPEPYAMDTRGELGAWRIELKYQTQSRVVVGAEKDFPGLSQIQRNFDADLGFPFPIHDTMEDTAEAALEVAGCP